MSGPESNLAQLVARHPLVFKGKAPQWSELPAGWVSIADEICTTLATELPHEQLLDLEVAQIKEKFATLQFYVHGVDNAMHRRINALCAKSQRVCMDCGEPSTVRRISGWFTTLCDFCLREKDIREQREYLKAKMRWVGKKPPE